MRQAKITDYLLLILLALIWASAFFNIKIATYSYGPVTIAFLRVFFGAIPVLLLCYYKNIKIEAFSKDWHWFAMIGFINLVAPFYLIAYGVQSVQSNLAAILMSTAPLSSTVLGHFYTTNEKFNFIKTFGNPNPNKENRYSWSGSCVPIYNSWNSNGQLLTINENNDIIIYYSFSNDTRSKKIDFPLFLHNDNIVIALWKSSKMKPHIDNKFDKKGFFICKKIGNTYEKICFGKAFNFEYFIECIKNKKIIFDSGMYDGNSRNYSQFRGSCFWNELITEEY